MKLFYVYQITFEDNSYYIGYRGSCQAPLQDILIKYFTSSKVVKEKLKVCDHSVTILLENLSQSEGYYKEQELISHSINDPLCLNQRCFYDRKGFGVLAESAKEKMRISVKERWKDPEYKKRLSEVHKNRWTEEQKEKQRRRLTGVKRPEHSEKLKGRKGKGGGKGVKKKDGHGQNVSKALTGKSKSDAHKQNLSGPKVRVCRLHDRREMSVNHFSRWLKKITHSS